MTAQSATDMQARLENPLGRRMFELATEVTNYMRGRSLLTAPTAPRRQRQMAPALEDGEIDER